MEHLRTAAICSQRNREIEELEKNVKDLDKQIAELKTVLRTSRRRRACLREDVESNKASLQEAYIAQNTAKMNVERAMEQKNGERERVCRFTDGEP